MYKKIEELKDILEEQLDFVEILIDERETFNRLKEIEELRDIYVVEDIENGNKNNLLAVWKESTC